MREDGTPERAHGKVLWHVTMSVDGFIGRDDAMDWVFRHDGWTPAAQAAVNNIGAILAGRRLYDLGISSGQGKPYGGTWTGPILVLTHRPSPPPNDPSVAFVSNGIDEAVATALEAASGRDVVLFGASIARQYIDRGLVDEILIHLAPVLLGDGVRLFDDPAAERVELEKLSVADEGQSTDLRFRVTPRPPR